MRRFGLTISCLAALMAVFSGGAAHATTTQVAQRLCPIPVVGGDADRVTLFSVDNEPGSYQVVIDESVGEASHAVVGRVVITSIDGAATSDTLGSVNAGLSPVAIDL